MPSPDERSVGDDDGDDFPLPEGSIPGRRFPSPDERSVGDDDGDDFPLPEGSIPGRTALPEL